MLGAVIGDIAGSRFEHDNIKTKDFDLFNEDCCFTDDTVMSAAIAQAIMNHKKYGTDLEEEAVKCMQQLGRKYIDAGYGGSFIEWLTEETPMPYNSWGNGSAMRVSPCGFAAESLEEAEAFAEKTAAVTHNHPEGIKGAKAVAAAIFLAKQGKSKAEIKKYISSSYYDMDFTLESIREDYTFDVSCQGSVPQAIEAFLESVDFEDAIRNAISIGGDSDTIAAVSGSIAEAFYGIPDCIRNKACEYLTDDIEEIINDFENTCQTL